MKTKHLFTVVAALLALSGAVAAGLASRPRIIVLTDISNEPDDEESMVRFLVYANELVDNPWLEANVIRNHGSLGALYPKLAFIMEGDTPSFLGLIDNGLGWAESPAYGGWGGRYAPLQGLRRNQADLDEQSGQPRHRDG